MFDALNGTQSVTGVNALHGTAGTPNARAQAYNSSASLNTYGMPSTIKKTFNNYNRGMPQIHEAD